MYGSLIQNVFVHPGGQLRLVRPEEPRQVGGVGTQAPVNLAMDKVSEQRLYST